MNKSFILENVFQNHMMFQADQPIRLFGESKSIQSIIITLFDRQYFYSISSGKFMIELPLIPYISESFKVIIESSNGQKQIINDCIFGDIYVASGQSNMQFVLKDCIYDEIIESSQIRLYEVPKLPYENAHIEFPYLYSSNPSWSHCTKEEALKFSTIGYLVATQLYQTLKRPIGIISCNMGDTSVFSWTDSVSLQNNPVLKSYLDFYQTELDKYRSIEEYNERFNKQLPRLMEFYGQIDKGIKSGLPSDKAHEEAYKYYPDPYIPMGPKHYNRPAGCYEMMISKIMPLSIKGFLFYQGESDHQNCRIYEDGLRTLITSVRTSFKNAELPFIYVQIANYSYPGTEKDAIASIREAQNNCIDVNKHVYMVTALDQGESENIHPRDKRIVSKRLGNVILEYIYQTEKDSLSPQYESHQIMNDESILISLKNNPLPLKSLSGLNKGFYALNKDSALIPITNVVVNEHNILIQNVDHYREIRYGFENNPILDIYSKNDLPLLPFRIKL